MITTDNYLAFASSIATDGDPLLHSPAAMERFMKRMGPWIIKVPTPSGKFHARNKCELIEFKTDHERQTYLNAERAYIEKCQKLAKEPAQGMFYELTIRNQFRMAADTAKAEQVADRLALADRTEDKSPIFAACFRPAIARVARILCLKHGYSRNDISIIWGGDDTMMAKNRLTPVQMKDWLFKFALQQKVPRKIMRQIERQLIETTEDQHEIEQAEALNLRLGTQSKQARQEEIDRFQSGKTRICLFTFAAGGVGLSLHHTDKDERGRSVVLRPRKTFLTPTYSAQDFVQGLGRAHRTIFSLSDTEQIILFYKGTIEEYVMEKVSIKLRCLTKTIATRESWADAIWKAAQVEEDKRREVILGNDANEKDFDIDEVDLNNPESEDDDE